MSGYPPQYGQFQDPPGTFPAAKPSGNPFADPQNPYAAPQLGGYYQPVPQPGNLPPFAGLWRQGNVLVMHKSAPLPEICLKSNLPAKNRLKRNLSWHHPAVFLAILVHFLLYIVIALIIRKTATIHIAITDEWLAIRRRRMAIAWGMVLVCVLLFAVGFALVINEIDWGAILLAFSFPLVIGAAIYGLLACRLVAPKRMTDEYIWLKGVHPEFLNRLEVWPYNI